MPDWIRCGSLVIKTGDPSWNLIAEKLLSRFASSARDERRPVWLGLFDSDQAGRIAVFRALARDGLTGWSAPQSCLAVSVVATGRVTALDGSAYPGSTPAKRVGLCCVVGRTGGVGWVTSPPGPLSDLAPDEGRVMDCLKRCVHLATPPSHAGPGTLIDLIWLALVVEEGQKQGALLPWSTVEQLRRHIGIERAAAAWTWESIRAAAAGGAWPDGPVPAPLAAWMDDGMFARAVLDSLPGQEALRSLAERYLSPSARDQFWLHLGVTPGRVTSSIEQDSNPGGAKQWPTYN